MTGKGSTEERILRAACELANEGGTEALTTRGVAERAGVSPGSVHHHYINKEGLVDACIDVMYNQVAELAGTFHEVVAETREPKQFLEQAVRRTFRLARDYQPMVRMLLVTVAQKGQLDAARMETVQMPFFAVAAPYFAAVTGLGQTDVRVRLQCMFMAIGRFAVSSSEELKVVTGSIDPTVIEDHLVVVAQALFPSR